MNNHERVPEPDEAGPDVSDQSASIVSGLRNPVAAVRRVGVAALLLEVLVLLLALQPMRQLGYVPAPIALTAIAALAVLLVVNAALLRHDWAWRLAVALQLAIAAAAVVHLAMLVLGVLFLLIWLYVLRVRRTVLGASRPRE